MNGPNLEYPSYAWRKTEKQIQVEFKVVFTRQRVFAPPVYYLSEPHWRLFGGNIGETTFGLLRSLLCISFYLFYLLEGGGYVRHFKRWVSPI